MMSSVDRALSLLRHFTVETPEIGLSALARTAGYDKTTTLRCLNALEKNGFVEQHPETRKYRIGIAPLQLARLRESSFPVQRLIQPVLDRIAREVRETAHASLLTHNQLVTVAVADPDRATRAFVDPAESLPLHATAAGHMILAALPAEDVAALNLPDTFEAFTPRTPTTRTELGTWVDKARATGISRAAETFEEDVVGTAVTLLGWSGKPVGTIAVAAVAARFDAVLGARIDAALTQGAREISLQLGA